MFGELTREKESDGRLDLAGRDGGPLVVVSQPGGFGGNPLEDVIDKRVHDRHGFGRDSSVRMHLFQDLVDVDGVGFLPLAVLLLISLGDVLLGLTSFLRRLTACFGSHHFAEDERTLNDARLFQRHIYIAHLDELLNQSALGSATDSCHSGRSA